MAQKISELTALAGSAVEDDADLLAIVDDGAAETKKITPAALREGMGLAPSAFAARLSTTQSNVTGDGTAYDVIFDAEDVDSAGAYNPATGVFTCKKAGPYLFCWSMAMTDANFSGNLAINIVTTARNFQTVNVNPSGLPNAGFGFLTLSGAIVAVMALDDTAFCRVQASGAGADQVDVVGDASTGYTTFAGFRLP